MIIFGQFSLFLNNNNNNNINNHNNNNYYYNRSGNKNVKISKRSNYNIK